MASGAPSYTDPSDQSQTDVPAGGSTPALGNDTTDTPATQPQGKTDDASPSSFTGYGPIEGTRYIKDYIQSRYAKMSTLSDNPGLYVRQKFDMDKKIDGFGQNLTLKDAQGIIDQVVDPMFDQLDIKSTQDNYDSRGKALLDQIYAPVGHGSTKPTWDQVPKNERIASMAYAAVKLFTGHGDQALQALARPLTEAEQENIKKENEKQQNEQLRRQGLVEQFKVLMGDKSAEVAALEARQRQDAIDRRADARIESQHSLEDQKELNRNRLALDTNFDTMYKAAKSPEQRMAAIDQYEKKVSDLTGKPYHVEQSVRDSAKQLTPSEHAQKTLDDLRQETIRENKLKLQPFLDKVHAQIDSLNAGTARSNQQTANLKYTLDNILPTVADKDRKQVAKLVLDIDKLNNERLHGWISTAKDGTLLRDAQGNLIMDSGGNPIRNLGEGRSKTAEMDRFLDKRLQELSADFENSGMSQDALNGILSIIRRSIRGGLSPNEIEQTVNGIASAGSAGLSGSIDKDLLNQAIAIEQQRASNESLEQKLGGAQASPAHQGDPKVGDIVQVPGHSGNWQVGADGMLHRVK